MDSRSVGLKSKESIGVKGHFIITIRDELTGHVKRQSEYDNLVVTVGLSMIADRLEGGANDCDITYGAVGTGTTAPAASDTTLETELARKAVSTIASSGAAVEIRLFFGAAEANGVLTEIGYFGEAASATPDSGTLFNRAVISETKSSSETMTVDTTITLTSGS